MTTIQNFVTTEFLQNAYTKMGDLIMDQIVIPINTKYSKHYSNYWSTCEQIEKLHMLQSRPINKCLSKSPSVQPHSLGISFPVHKS